MTNTILIFDDAFGGKVRIHSDKIQSYRAVGDQTSIMLDNGEIQIAHPVEQIDQVFCELYTMVKHV